MEKTQIFTIKCVLKLKLKINLVQHLTVGGVVFCHGVMHVAAENVVTDRQMD